MIICLDACVLFPTVLREILIGVAREGAYRPIWSARILEEWQRAAVRRDPGDGVVAAGEIARLRAGWPMSEVAAGREDDLWLPDPADVHVLATARAGGAARIVTLNLRDFPARELAGHGIAAEHPDAFLYGLWLEDADLIAGVARAVHREAERLSGTEMPIRGLMKRARLPRLGKALVR